jgi:membrane-associated protein
MMQFLDFILHFGNWLKEFLTGLANEHLVAFYVVLFLIVFCETGLVVTPLLPGDSLLFAVGTLAALAGSNVSLPLVFVLLIAAALFGDNVNYHIGRWLGPRVFQFEKSWLFNKKHLLEAQAFYEKYGALTLILARFVPIVRTFAPFVAGIGKMSYRKFLLFSVAGAVGWVTLCLLSGYFLARVQVVQDNFEAVLVAVVLVSVLPMAVKMALAWRRKRAAARAAELKATEPEAERVA